LSTYQFKIKIPEGRPEYLEKIIQEWKTIVREERNGISSVLQEQIADLWKLEEAAPKIYLVPFNWDSIFIYAPIQNQEILKFIRTFIANKFPDIAVQEKRFNEFDLKAYAIFDKEAEFNKETEFTYSEEVLVAIKKMGDCIEKYFFDFNIPGDNREDMHEFNWDESYTSWKGHIEYRTEKKIFPYHHYFITVNRMYSFVESEFYYVEFEDLDNFSVFFAFRLRNTPLTKINSFLDYHFKQNSKDFLTFLDSNLVEYVFLYNEKVIKIVEKWFLKKEKLKSIPVEIQNQFVEANSNLRELVDKQITTNKWEDLVEAFEINERYYPIGITLNQQQTRKFFSFLYKETNRTKIPFLSEKDTKKLLRYGLSFSENPNGTYYFLSLDKKNKPIQIIYYCFSELNGKTFSKYEKESIAKFLKFNFENFKDIPLHKIKNSMRSDRRPKKMYFEISRYLPF